MPDPVRAQYETLPYPPRDPRDETKRLIIGSPSHLAEVNHFIFGGRIDWRRPFRVLIAGGGTGDAAIMIAQQLVDAGAAAAEVVYLDLSQTSRAIAEARAATRQLKNIKFITGSLLDVARLALGPFDYIDCCGVLHHLDDPDAGLAALARVLAPQGGMGIMVYGALGRTGVYHVQEMLTAVGRDGDDAATRLRLARRLLDQLPPTNWLKRNPFVTDHLAEGDAGLYDLLLHARDRAYTVDDVAALVQGAGLRLVSFIPSARYEPASYLSDASLLKRVAELPPLARAALAERLAGNIKTHTFYAVRADNAIQPATPDTFDVVPILLDDALARGLKPNGTLTVTVDGLTLRFALPRLAPAIAALIDGKRDLAAIHRAFVAKAGAMDETAFKTEFDRLYAILHGIGKLLIARPPTP